MSRKKRKLTEDAAWEIALKEHPQWRKDALPEEIIGEDGEPMSPRLHLQMHVVVERQLAANDPKGVVAIAAVFKQAGFTQHEIRHDMGCVLAQHIWHMTKEGRVFDEKQYLADLREIAESHR